MKCAKLPPSFKHLLWSYRFLEIDPEEDQERIIVNTVNYGDWDHWRWLVNYYGVNKLRKVITNLPASEFRARALKLISLMLGIKTMRYATRGAKIRATRNF